MNMSAPTRHTDNTKVGSVYRAREITTREVWPPLTGSAIVVGVSEPRTDVTRRPSTFTV